jgi:hypothetical protein
MEKMKTIEQGKENELKLFRKARDPKYNEDDKIYSQYVVERWLGKSFIAGVEFAQRWIGIDDELPEDGTDVLVLIYRSGCQGRQQYGISHFENGNFYIDGAPNRDVAFWRKIELK